MSKHVLSWLTVLFILAGMLAGCVAPAAAPTPAPAAQAPEPTAVPPTAAPEPTKAPEPTAVPPTAAPEPTKAPEPTQATEAPKAHDPTRLILATTTSTADSGLLDFILPDFEKLTNSKVDVIAVGSGQAIEIGTKGDADVLLVHSRKAEDKFVADGYAKERFDVMYNDFIVVGPKDDPAKITGMTASKDAFKAIMDAQRAVRQPRRQVGHQHQGAEHLVVGRHHADQGDALVQLPGPGDGRHAALLQREGRLHPHRSRHVPLHAGEAAQPDDPGGWPESGREQGQGAAESLRRAGRQPGEASRTSTPTWPDQFVEWIIAADTQKIIGGYGADKFGQPLFYPSSEEYKATREVTVKIGDEVADFHPGGPAGPAQSDRGGLRSDRPQEGAAGRQRLGGRIAEGSAAESRPDHRRQGERWQADRRHGQRWMEVHAALGGDLRDVPAADRRWPTPTAARSVTA